MRFTHGTLMKYLPLTRNFGICEFDTRMISTLCLQGIHYFRTPTISRFHPNNQFHQLHDEIIGLFHQMKQDVAGGSFWEQEDYSNDRVRFLVLDGFRRSNASRLYDYLTSKPARYRDYLNIDKDVVTCFRDAILGSPASMTWYQYGFGGIPVSL